MVAAFCGLRLGELLELHWRAIDFTGSAIHVESSYVRNAKGTPKSGAARTVPMARGGRPALAAPPNAGRQIRTGPGLLRYARRPRRREQAAPALLRSA